jgi:hypothetical protein
MKDGGKAGRLLGRAGARPDTGVPPVLDTTNSTGGTPMSHFVPMRGDYSIEKRRRNLPHWEQIECTYFVTFRLADSLPVSKLTELREENENWKREHPEPWTEQIKRDFDLLFNRRIERWLDNGFGSCLLKTRSVREIVEETLIFFDGRRYILDCYVAMPNHVHVLVHLFAAFLFPGYFIPGSLSQRIRSINS